MKRDVESRIIMVMGHIGAANKHMELIDMEHCTDNERLAINQWKAALLNCHDALQTLLGWKEEP
jgi:hypothetical protein